MLGGTSAFFLAPLPCVCQPTRKQEAAVVKVTTPRNCHKQTHTDTGRLKLFDLVFCQLDERPRGRAPPPLFPHQQPMDPHAVCPSVCLLPRPNIRFHPLHFNPARAVRFQDEGCLLKLKYFIRSGPNSAVSTFFPFSILKSDYKSLQV